jgi:hypothetical protein
MYVVYYKSNDDSTKYFVRSRGSSENSMAAYDSPITYNTPRAIDTTTGQAL